MIPLALTTEFALGDASLAKDQMTGLPTGVRLGAEDRSQLKGFIGYLLFMVAAGTVCAPTMMPASRSGYPAGLLLSLGTCGGAMRILSRTSAVISAITLTAGLVVAAATSARAATVTDLYVNNATGSCSDTGSGTWEQPFCTIGAAAAIAQPGQTVHVKAGTYPAFTVATSGTPDAPVTFQADGFIYVGLVGGTDGPGITISNVHDVRVNGFVSFSSSTPNQAILISNATDITVNGGAARGGWKQTVSPGSLPAVQVTGTSSHVTISREAIKGLGSGVQVDPGVTGTLITTNVIDSLTDTGVQVTGATGTVVTSNTIVTSCHLGIGLSGGAVGAVLENNILQTSLGTANPEPCSDPATATGISVTTDSVPGTVADYNLTDPTSGGNLYDWGGTGYTGLAAFTAATGQGTHDLAANPMLTNQQGGDDFWFSLTAGSPAVDSANASAPGELDSDKLTLPHLDQTSVANTGTGPGYFDRGAVELQLPSGGPVFITGGPQVTTTGPLAVTASIQNGPFITSGGWPAGQQQPGTWTFNFGDGTAPVVTTAKTVPHTYRRAGHYTVTISESYADFQKSLFNPVKVGAVAGAYYTPVTPVRVLDTRSAVGVSTTTPVPAGGTLSLSLPSVNGVAAADISAVVLNVAVTQPAKGGWLGVYPGGQSPGTSNLDFTAGHTAANLVTVQLNGGKVDFLNSSGGTVHVLADLEGYYAAAGDGFQPQAPVRVLDTRNGTGAPAGALGTGQRLHLNLTGKVPAGTAAIALNVTASQPQKNGYLTVYPDGPTRPGVSTVDFTSGQTVADMVIVPLSNGTADIYNGSSGTVHVLADLMGYFSATAPDLFVPYGPARVYDSRDTQPVPAQGTLSVGKQTYADCGPCPLDGAMVYNITAIQPAGTGYLTVYPGGTRPAVSTVDFTPGKTVPNLVSVISGGTYATTIYNGSGGTVHVIVDEQGYYIRL